MIALGLYKFVATMIVIWIIGNALGNMRDGYILRNLGVVIVCAVLLIALIAVVISDLNLLQTYINE